LQVLDESKIFKLQPARQKIPESVSRESRI